MARRALQRPRAFIERAVFAKKTNGKRASAAKPAPSETPVDGTGRAYRTMPDDFAAVYNQVGTVGGLMD